MNSELKIPKIIHYCWFGKKKKNKLIEKCISTWKMILPDYEIIEWNEENFNINWCLFTQQAYESGKYAFVSDIARLYALYNYGGIYLDTDIKIIKRFDDLLDSDFVAAFESETKVMTAFIGAAKENEIIATLYHLYDNKQLFNTEGHMELTPNTIYLTDLLCEQYGLVLNGEEQRWNNRLHIYTMETFGAYDADNTCYNCTDKTALVHKCIASWSGTKWGRIWRRILSKVLGRNLYRTIRLAYKKFMSLLTI